MSTPATEHDRTEHASSGEYRCDECDKTFPDTRTRAAHKGREHGDANRVIEGGVECEIDGCTARFPTYRRMRTHMGSAAHNARKARGPNKPKAEPSVAPQPSYDNAFISDVATKLRSEVQQLDAKIAQASVDLTAMREARQRLNNALRSLVPQPSTPGRRPNVDANLKDDAQKIDETQAYIEAHTAQLADGFTSKSLYDSMRQDGGQAIASVERLKKYLGGELRDRGIVRLDKLTRGGGQMFKPVAALALNGSGGHDDGTA
jgi:hypothetical protein